MARGKKQPPSFVLDLSELCPHWSGWNLNTRTGELYPPGGQRPFRPGDLAGLHWYFEQLAAQRAELRARVASLEAENRRLRRRAAVKAAGSAWRRCAALRGPEKAHRAQASPVGCGGLDRPGGSQISAGKR